MSIQLQGNSDSSFSNDVVIGSGKITLSGADGTATFGGRVGIGNDIANDSGVRIYAEGAVYTRYDTTDSGSAVWKSYNGGFGDADLRSAIYANGSAAFQGDIQVTQSAGTERTIQVGTISTPGKVSIRSNGNAYFAGTVTQGNTLLNLDTGGTIDVKERIQNTQAILYRLKAALIQPDADANQLRTRLLEALDILTSDGDES